MTRLIERLEDFPRNLQHRARQIECDFQCDYLAFAGYRFCAYATYPVFTTLSK